MTRSSLVVAACALALASLPSPAQAVCRSAKLCRKAAPEGKLIRNRVWTSPCGPNTERGGRDPICEDIVKCSAAGGFGKFLAAVTGDCKSKTFDGYYGLDGMTYGILDFTADNLPSVFEAGRKRNAAKFDQIFAGAGVKMNGDCLDPAWACDWNQQGKLNCDSKFRPAMEKFLRDPDMQKGQLDVTLRMFKQRIDRYKSLGLRTQYGLVAMAVVANNLPSRAGCRPSEWKQRCSAQQGDEPAMVDCMLDLYAQNGCRGSASGAQRRKQQIQKTFSSNKSAVYSDPDTARIVGCSSKWGSGSGAHGSGGGSAQQSAPKKAAKKKKH